MGGGLEMDIILVHLALYAAFAHGKRRNEIYLTRKQLQLPFVKREARRALGQKIEPMILYLRMGGIPFYEIPFVTDLATLGKRDGVGCTFK